MYIHICIYNSSYLSIYAFVRVLVIISYNTCEPGLWNIRFTYVCYMYMCLYTCNYIPVYTYAQTDRVRVYGLVTLPISGFVHVHIASCSTYGSKARNDLRNLTSCWRLPGTSHKGCLGLRTLLLLPNLPLNPPKVQLLAADGREQLSWATLNPKP